MHFSFSATAKTESIKYDMSKIQLKYFLAGFFLVHGSTQITKNLNNMHLNSTNATIIKEIYKKFNHHFPDFKTNISVLKTRKFKNNNIYSLEIENGLVFFDLLFGFDYRYISENFLIPKKIEHQDYLKYFINGIFVANGSVSRPNSKFYHLEFSIDNILLADKILIKLKKYFPNFKILERKNRAVFYIKKANDVSDFLKFINAPNMVILFENSRISRDFINSINRLNNFDIYNQEKINSGFARHLIIIKQLQARNLIDDLDSKYKNFIKVRIDNPESSLVELSDIMNQKYQSNITKSGLNHWIRHLKKISSQL